MTRTMHSTELRLFRAIVAVIAFGVTPVGVVAGYGGLEGMAALLGRDTTVVLDAGIRNHLRAICVVFAGFGALVLWSTFDLKQRRGAFRISMVAIVAAALARVTGWRVDGDPGALAKLFLSTEIGVFPLLFLWHFRLLGRS